MITFECSKEIAEHVSEIVIFGGGYELLKVDRSDLRIEKGSYDHLKVPKDEKHEPTSHEWMRLSPHDHSSFFSIDLMDKTPKRYNWSE